MHENEHILAWLGNWASAGAVVSTLIGWLPPIAAIIAFIWYLIQIYESDTFQKVLTHRRKLKIDKLRDKLKALEAKSPLND